MTTIGTAAAPLPKQVLRLCALGMLVRQPQMAYADLAAGVDDFTGRLTGPMLDMRGSSLELLRYEGLMVPLEETARSDEAAGTPTVVALAPAGRAEFAALMALPLSAPMTEVIKLAVVLKIRFLDLLPADRQAVELADLIAAHEAEITRLTEIKGRHAGEAGLLSPWLDHDIDLYGRRVAWLRGIADRLPLTAPA